MTAFDCNVTGSPADATPIMAPVDPNWCSREDWDAGTCTENTGAKRPLCEFLNAYFNALSADLVLSIPQTRTTTRPTLFGKETGTDPDTMLVGASRMMVPRTISVRNQTS